MKIQLLFGKLLLIVVFPSNMTRDYKLEVLGREMSQPIGGWGTHYSGKTDTWYIFPLRNGDACVRNTTVWKTEEQAREYVRLIDEDY